LLGAWTSHAHPPNNLIGCLTTGSGWPVEPGWLYTPTARGSRTGPGAGALRSCFCPSSEHSCRSSREAPPGLRVAPVGPRVSTAPGERGMAPPRSTRRATSCSVLSIAAVAAPHTGGRSFRAEVTHRSRCGPNAQIAHTRSVSAQTAVIQGDKGRESVGVPLSLNGGSGQRRDRRPKQPQSGQHSARWILATWSSERYSGAIQVLSPYYEAAAAGQVRRTRQQQEILPAKQWDRSPPSVVPA
jgi:hypothetical protein